MAQGKFLFYYQGGPVFEGSALHESLKRGDGDFDKQAANAKKEIKNINRILNRTKQKLYEKNRNRVD